MASPSAIDAIVTLEPMRSFAYRYEWNIAGNHLFKYDPATKVFIDQANPPTMIHQVNCPDNITEQI